MLIKFRAWFWKWRFMSAARRLREFESLPSAGHSTSGGSFAYSDSNVRNVINAMKAKELERMEHAAGELAALATSRAFGL